MIASKKHTEDFTLLIGKSIAGDQPSISSLYSYLIPHIRASVRRSSFNISGDELDDFVQEIALHILYKKLKSFKLIEGIKSYHLFSWVQIVAKNFIIDTYRKNQRKFQSNNDKVLLGDYNGKLISHELNSEEILINFENNTALYSAINQMDCDKKKLIEAFYFNGESIKSISEKEGKTVRAITMNLFKARRILRNILSPKHD